MARKQKLYQKYDHAVIACDVIIFTVRQGQLQTLLIQMKKAPFQNMWAFPGGLVHGNESIEEAARRQLKERAGVSKVFLEQLGAFGEVNRDPYGRVVSVAYFALLSDEGIGLRTTDEYSGIDWFPIRQISRLAYDHADMLKAALGRLREKMRYSPIVASLLGSEFTLPQLQQLYEIVLEKKLDKRNFRKWVLSQGFVKSTGQRKRGGAHRPAALYRFATKGAYA